MDELGERLAQGDPAAFAALYDACADRLHHYLVVRLGSRDDADDVLQETFLRLARMRRRLAKVDNITAYVFATARNEASRFSARNPRHQTVADAAALYCETNADVQQQRETAEAVTAALARLTPEQREVITLRITLGMRLREIAQITGLPQGTVATRYRVAIGRLRDWFMRKCHE
jgi:RNA polymerase sigma-70 factor (ECF subfamily)